MMHTWMFLISWIHLFGFGATEQNVAATAYANVDGLQYLAFIVDDMRGNYAEAQESCRRFDGNLAVIYSERLRRDIARSLLSKLGDYPYIYIGLKKRPNARDTFDWDIENIPTTLPDNWQTRSMDRYWDYSPGPYYSNNGCVTLIRRGGRNKEHAYRKTNCLEKTAFLCQRNVKICRPNPCQNGGTCVRDICTCLKEYTGSICQIALNNQTVYEWGIHTFTFHGLYRERKTFAGALQSCAAKNSRLVEISTKAINEYLKRRMRTYSTIDFAWTGGSDLQKTNSWLWNNRTAIDTSRTKWGWRGVEPNGRAEHCLAVSNTGWVDLGCYDKLTYICEQVGVSRIEYLSTTDLTVSGGGTNNIRCDLRGIHPQPSVSWYFEEKEVAGSSTNSVYQTKGQGYATLKTQHATITEEGSYTCYANNTIGNESYNATGTSAVKVPSCPRITSLTLKSCYLLITWKPNKRAMGIKHRITVSNGADNITSMVTPTTENQETDVARKLKPSTSYDIRIAPCPKGCKTEYAASRNVVTGGRPGIVRHASVLKIGPRGCNVTWKSPSVTPSDPITEHKIYIRESIASLSTTSFDNNIREETRSIDSNLTYLFHGKPNRKYSFGVQAVTCAGAGLGSNVTGTCTTDKQAPFDVPKPIVPGAINKEGTANLSVPIPDQKNGPLSCLFVMVRPKGFATGYLPNNLNQLQTANESSPGSEYIAVALTATRLTGISKSITLGDGAETSCDVYSITSRKRRSANEDGIFVGRNKKLDPKNEYNVYAVSTTPSGGKVFVKSSEIQNLQSKTDDIDTPSGLSTTTVIIIASIVGCLLLIAIIVSIVIFMKRRKQNADGSNEHVYEYPTIPIGLQEQPGYEIVEQNHPQRRIGVLEDSAYETYDDQQPHPVNDSNVVAASPTGGEGEYEVPMRQYEEIK